MAVRLSVLLVQSSQMSGLQSGINADLVFRLMGVPGIDLSIVNSLVPSEIAETDRLLLSALDGDLAILDWRPPDDTVTALAKLDIIGARAPHELDPHPPTVSAGTRKLYLVDLRNGDPTPAVVDALRRLLDRRRVVAVPLSIAAPAAANPTTPRPSANRDSITAGQPSPAASVSNPSVSNSGAPPRQSPTPPGTVASADRVNHEPTDRELDALVDGLNSTDW